MKKTLLTLFAMTLVAFSAVAESDIAIVKMDAIKDLLLECASLNPANEMLIKKHRASAQKMADQQKKMQAMILKGGKIDPMAMARGGAVMDFATRRKINELAQGQLILIVDKIFPKKYKLILNDTHQTSILYTTTAIPDLTSNVKQYLLKKIAQQ